MSKEQIKIKNISIKLLVKEFAYYDSDSEKVKLKEDNLREEFKKKNFISHEEYIGGWNNRTLVHYYRGKVEFMPVKNDESTIEMDIKLSQDVMNSVMAMCLDTVCELCEKQTKAFQDTFVNFVKDTSEALTNQTEKMKQGLISRGVDKLLTIKGKNNDK